MKRVVERFKVGGTNGHPSMPSDRLQAAIGREIQVDIMAHTLGVPTDDGIKIADVGSTIICYSDGTYDVERS